LRDTPSDNQIAKHQEGPLDDKKFLRNRVEASRRPGKPKFGGGSVGLIAAGAIFVAALFIGFVVYGLT